MKRIVHRTGAIVKRKLTSGRHVAPQTAFPGQYSIDSPTKTTTDSTIVTVEGWIIPENGLKVLELRARFADTTIDMPYGAKRGDVAKAFPGNPAALMSGFSAELEISEDAQLTIEVDIGKGFQTLYKISLKYSPEALVADLINPDLAVNFAEHVNLLNNKKAYYFEEANKATYKRHPKDPRLIAFYLPQFHPIPENDRVWGEGFTEWTNVTTGQPRFIGHNQPLLPKDTGFYDLRLEHNIESQIERAKKYGIYGFCFYYYWFSGKRLLEKPLNSFLEHKEWDFNFTICWANENWTKRWDGRDSEVIIAQKYRKEDPLLFIKDVEDTLNDPRYIQEDGKPVLVVFRASELKDPGEYARVWREYFRKKHNKELHLVSIISFEDKDPREYGFDMALDFAPQSAFFKNETFPDNRYPYLDVGNTLIDKNFSGMIADYRQIALNKKAQTYFKYPIYKSVTPSWDNEARKKNKGFVMQNESPSIYAQWLDDILALETKDTESPMVFINAWNEWAEGAVLEPTMHYGSAILNRTSEVLSKYSHEKTNKINFARWGVTRNKDTKTAVVLHLYYPERWQDIQDKLANIASKYDLFISLNLKDAHFKEQILESYPKANIQIVPNRGRDILPFIDLLPKLKAAGYDNLLKLHSKKSLHRKNGSDWCREMLDGLVGSSEQVEKILAQLSVNKSLIGPDGHFVSLSRYMGGNQAHLEDLLTRIYGNKKAQSTLKNSSSFGYFAGSMFWGSLEVFDPLIQLHLLPEDFESEQGQIDGTTAHAVERLISLIAEIEHCKISSANTRELRSLSQKDALTDYSYAE